MNQKKIVAIFDGGGVKGFFSLSLSILIAQVEEGPISEIFDILVGVSIGSWVSALISFRHLDNAEERSQLHSSIKLELGDTFREKNKLGPLLAPKYSGQGKRDTLIRIFGKYTKFGDAKVPLVVLCATLGGSDRIFQSWNPKHKDLLLVDILDASSAVPVYFPPVKINNEYLIDGGVISNKPLELAYVQARILFGKGIKFKMLSIGTQSICGLKIENEDTQSMGLVSWLAMGLFDIAIGVGNNIPIMLMEDLLGDDFMRVACNCALLTTDELTEQANHIMVNSIQETWQNDGTKIKNFLQNK